MALQKKKDTELPAGLSEAATAANQAITTGSLLFSVEFLWPIEPVKLASFAGAIFGLMLRVLPAYVRGWFSDLRDRSKSSVIESFTKAWCSPSLIANELSQVCVFFTLFCRPRQIIFLFLIVLWRSSFIRSINIVTVSTYPRQ